MARRGARGESYYTTTTPGSWTHLFGVVFLCSGLVTRTVQQGEGDDGGDGEGGETGTSSQGHQTANNEEGCTLCHPHAPAAWEEFEGGGTVVGCRCKQYKYLSEWDRVSQFYNIDQCTGFTQVPNFTAQCPDDVLELSLNDNVLGDISAYAFHGLSFVENKRYLAELRLSNVSLTRLDPRAFEGIRGVVHVLDLSHNRLGTLPEAIYGLPYLQKLLLNNNGVTLETLQPTLDGGSRNGSVHLENVRIIDLSNNYLTSVPDLRPRSDESSQLQELRLHGNPIVRDLSNFAPLLARHRKLQKVTWPLRTVSCACVTMVTLARNIYSDFNFPVIYPLGEEVPGVFTEWRAVTCDAASPAPFVGRPIGLLSDEEVREECAEWAAKEPFISEVRLGVTQAASGYTVIRPVTSGSGSSVARICVVLLALVHLGVTLLTRNDRWW